MRLPYHLIRALWRRMVQRHRPSSLSFAQVVNRRSWACADLGAFRRPLPGLDGLDGVVIMEDRDPAFFLSFRDYTPGEDTRLNRHGPLHAWSTQQDLRDLVSLLHSQRIKVAIGFWNYGGWLFHRRPRWLREHRELTHLPLSSHLYPFVRLQPEGMDYSDYIAHQYERLRGAFGFDGLMLGDGLCGFGSIWDPDLYRDREGTIPQWTHLYEVIADAVHRTQGVLLAYDQMGFSLSEAREHGVEYRALARAGLDVLVYQSYPQAWGGFWLEEYRSRFDLNANIQNLLTIKTALAGTNTHVLYTLELGDSVERWRADPRQTATQRDTLDPLADGRFLVWANDIIACLRGPDHAEGGSGDATGHTALRTLGRGRGKNRIALAQDSSDTMGEVGTRSGSSPTLVGEG